MLKERTHKIVQRKEHVSLCLGYISMEKVKLMRFWKLSWEKKVVIGNICSERVELELELCCLHQRTYIIKDGETQTPMMNRALYSSRLSKCQNHPLRCSSKLPRGHSNPLLSFISHKHSMSISWEPEAPKLWDLMPDDLRKSGGNSNNNRKKGIQST